MGNVFLKLRPQKSFSDERRTFAHSGKTPPLWGLVSRNGQQSVRGRRYCNGFQPPHRFMQKIFLLLFLLPALGLFAQDIPFIKAEQISHWKNAHTDTVYVLNFWATWCAPCVEELPSFEKLNKAYADKKVKVILISTDFKRNVESSVKPFVKKKKLESKVVFMNEPNPNNYINAVDSTWSGAIPATLVWSKQKGVSQFFEKKLTYEELEAAVKKGL